MSTAQTFFISGSVPDRAYVNIRELPHNETGRQFVEELWAEYSPFADRHFLTDARSHFLQRFWEMYLTIALKRRGFVPVKVSGEGPEFYFEFGGRQVWVEAVAPGPGAGQDAVPEPPLNQAYSIPQEKILLRFTNALAEKLKKYNEAVTKGIIDASDHYIVAINCRGIPNAPFGTYIPYGVMACLPFGHLEVVIDRNSLRVVDQYSQYRDQVLKLSGKPVSTDSLLNPNYSGVSGVLHSAVDPINRPAIMGEDFWFLHNPKASQPISLSVFSWCRQYVLEGDFLRTIQPNLNKNNIRDTRIDNYEQSE